MNANLLATDILASLDAGVITTDDRNNILGINPRGREILATSESGTEIATSSLPGEHRLLAELARRVLDSHRPRFETGVTSRSATGTSVT
ncbi:MAG: PAS domain-containing protein [Planctomycetaceae bacterium]